MFTGAMLLLSVMLFTANTNVVTNVHRLANGPADVNGPLTIYGDLTVVGNGTFSRSMSADSLTASTIQRVLSCLVVQGKGIFKDSLRVAGLFNLGVKAFANLGTPPNNTMYFCPDCTSPSSPATGSGNGAVVIRQNSIWKAL